MATTEEHPGSSGSLVEEDAELQLEREEEEDMRKTILFLEAAVAQEAEDELDMTRTLAMLSSVVQRDEDAVEEADMKRTMDLLDGVVAQEEEDALDMAHTIDILYQAARQLDGRAVRFADDIQVFDLGNHNNTAAADVVDDYKLQRQARRGKWKPGPAEDELWNGFAFRDVELTPEELEEHLSKRQFRATRILKGLFWANRKVDIEGHVHAKRIEVDDEDDNEDAATGSKGGGGGLDDAGTPSRTPSPTPPPAPAPAAKRRVRIPSIFLRKTTVATQ